MGLNDLLREGDPQDAAAAAIAMARVTVEAPTASAGQHAIAERVLALG